MQPTDPNSILQAIQTLANQSSVAVPVPNIPSLNYTAPNVSDLDAKYKEFLDRASKDPDIVNYYNQILQQAEGDTKIAQNFLEQDYQTGTRNIVANLHGTLQQMNLKFDTENKAQEDTLNKRGIALTQGQDGKLTYGGGGEAQSEIQSTQQDQALRQEAEKRSASQGVTGLAQSLQKGLTSTGQSLTQTAQNLQKQKESDIGQRAGTYYNMYQGQQQAEANKKLQDQQQRLSMGFGSEQLSPDQKSQYWKSTGHTGDVPVGWNG